MQSGFVRNKVVSTTAIDASFGRLKLNTYNYMILYAARFTCIYLTQICKFGDDVLYALAEEIPIIKRHQGYTGSSVVKIAC